MFETSECDVYEPSRLAERLMAEVNVMELLDDVPTRRTFVSSERHSQVSAEELSDLMVYWLATGKGHYQDHDAARRSICNPPIE